MTAAVSYARSRNAASNGDLSLSLAKFHGSRQPTTDTHKALALVVDAVDDHRSLLYLHSKIKAVSKQISMEGPEA